MEKRGKLESLEKKIVSRELKVYFIIFNLIIGTIAISFLIGNIDASTMGQPPASSSSTADSAAQALPQIINTFSSFFTGPPKFPSSTPNPNEGTGGNVVSNPTTFDIIDKSGKTISGYLDQSGRMIVNNPSAGTKGPSTYSTNTGQSGKIVNGKIVPDAGQAIPGESGTPAAGKGPITYKLDTGETGTFVNGQMIPDSPKSSIESGTPVGENIDKGKSQITEPPPGFLPNGNTAGGAGNKIAAGSRYTLSNGETGIIGANGERIPDAPTVKGAISNYFDNFLENLFYVGVGAGLGAIVGGLAGGKNGYLWGTISGVSGVVSYQVAKNFFPAKSWMPGLIGLGIAAAIFLATYKKENQKIVEFQCNSWQAPIGGADCEKCNDYSECSEYTCKSLGQACDLVNKGQKNQKCVWKNPYDTNSPTIQIYNVTAGYHSLPDNTIRPPATGVEILKNSGKCIKAFTPLTFSIKTDEPSQCKIDYTITNYSKDSKAIGLYDNMGYYVNGDSSFDYNHTETLSLPGPDDIDNSSAPEFKNDGTYTLYIRCEDANGNFNVDPFSVRFCVDPGPDTTPPMIVNVSIPSESPIQFNQSTLPIEVYVNEPADCKWSYEDGRAYDLMEYNMSCASKLWEMNNQNTYTCRANLTGIKSREDNIFYFRCLDKPGFANNDRNPDKQSYRYVVKGTQPLNIIKLGPDGIVKGATKVVNVTLNVQTDNGYNNGEAICYYSTTGIEKDYIKFSESGSNLHTQRQDLIPGNYTYYFKCVDLGGNADYNKTRFSVESDIIMPLVIRTYKENGELKIITDKEAECSYSNSNCNFEIDSGIKLSSIDNLMHYADWKTNENYYVRCKDANNNQPDPNTCSIIVRPVNLYEQGNAIEL
jgi:hypothetical protein